MRRFLYGLFLIPFIFSASVLHSQDTKNKDNKPIQEKLVVEATGEASGGENSTLKQVEEAALQDAKKNAMEQAGVYIKSHVKSYSEVTESDTYSKMLDVLEKEINSWAQGFVKILEVSDKKTEFDEKLKAFKASVKIKAEIQVADMKELATHVKEEEKTKSEKELKFEYNLVAERMQNDGSWNEVLIKEGSTLYTGDNFQIIFKTVADCYVYVLNVDAKKNIYALFPNPQAMAGNSLKSEVEYVLPDRDKFYQLDETQGIETIYLVASYAPMKDIEWIVKKAQEEGDSDKKVALLDSAIKTRGVSKIVSGNQKTYKLTDGKTIKKVTDMLEGKGSVVRIITFEHK